MRFVFRRPVEILGVGLLLCLPSDGRCVQSPVPPPEHVGQALADTATREQVVQRSSPGSRFPVYSRILAGLGGTLLGDRPMREAVEEWKGAGPRSLASIGSWYGDWRESAPFMLGGIIAVAVVSEGRTGFRTATGIVAGTLVGSFANEAVNLAVGRSRPLAEEGAWRFRPFNGHASFPSGHTALAFSLASSIDVATDNPMIEVAAYTLAGITAFSRVYDDKHWLSDVAVGALVGWGTGRLATRTTLALLGADRPPVSAREPSPIGTGRSITLLAAPTTFGVQLRF